MCHTAVGNSMTNMTHPFVEHAQQCEVVAHGGGEHLGTLGVQQHLQGKGATAAELQKKKARLNHPHCQQHLRGRARGLVCI